MLNFREYILEGVNDPSIFKAVFLAGGPGSGKSFIVGKTALTSFGLKLINSDPVFEKALSKAGLTSRPEDIFSPKGQEIRKSAKELTGKQMDLALGGRLGLVIDGTGKDYGKISQQSLALKVLGYDTTMIFVNTDLETSLARNKQRDRSLPDSEVKDMWSAVQKNIGKFQNLFGNQMIIIDNSDGSNFEGASMSAYKKMIRWTAIEPKSPAAQKWIKDQRKRNVK